MNPTLANAAAWCYGLAGFGYAAFALYLGFGWRGGLRGLALLVAVGLTSVWGLLGLVFALAPTPALLAFGAVADVLRIGAWYAFLLLLMERPAAGGGCRNAPRTSWLVPGVRPR